MKIVNKLFPVINSYDPNNPRLEWSSISTAAICMLQDATYIELRGWYCMFSCQHSFKLYDILDLIDEDSLQLILEKKLFLVLDNALEPFVKSIDSIYLHIVIKAGIPASQIILLTNMHDAGTYSRQLAQRLSQQAILIFWYRLFESDLQNSVNYVYKKNLPKTLTIKDYPKKYLSLNRRWRLHRPFLITLLHGRELLDKGHVSFGPCDTNDVWHTRWPELMHCFRNQPDIIDLLTQYSSVTNLPPMYLDTDQLYINRAEATADTNIFYENSYFSVISETTFFTKDWYDSARFLSEKAFKPIAMRHPFLLVSVPRSLEIYKAMGYKTFSPIIDESYDLETNDGKRMLMIVKEIRRLCDLQENELFEFIQHAREICEHNFQTLMRKKTFVSEI